MHLLILEYLSSQTHQKSLICQYGVKKQKKEERFFGERRKIYGRKKGTYKMKRKNHKKEKEKRKKGKRLEKIQNRRLVILKL